MKKDLKKRLFRLLCTKSLLEIKGTGPGTIKALIELGKGDTSPGVLGVLMNALMISTPIDEMIPMEPKEVNISEEMEYLKQYIHSEIDILKAMAEFHKQMEK